MKILTKETMIENIKFIIQIEPKDVDKIFVIEPVHIPYSMGCGSNIDIKIEEIINE